MESKAIEAGLDHRKRVSAANTEYVRSAPTWTTACRVLIPAADGSTSVTNTMPLGLTAMPRGCGSFRYSDPDHPTTVPPFAGMVLIAVASPSFVHCTA